MKPALQSVPHAIPDHAAASCCPSCLNQADGHYCAHCGEATRAHPPSAHEFMHEFVGHYVALEGKLWSTLRALMFAPGRLTGDHLRGRRVPFINPLRLYLTLSLIMFALIKLVDVRLPQLVFDDTSFGASYQHIIPNPDKPGKTGTATLYLVLSENDAQNQHWVQEAVTRLDGISHTWAGNVQRFVSAPKAEQAKLLNRGFMANLPYMLIGALPLFALYLKVMYWRSGRRYGEHLVFAFHVSAFVFLLGSLTILLPGNAAWLAMALYERVFNMISPWDGFKLLPVIWVVAYLALALRCVYGGGLAAAWARSLVLLTVHFTVILALAIGAQVIAVLKYS